MGQFLVDAGKARVPRRDSGAEVIPDHGLQVTRAFKLRHAHAGPKGTQLRNG
jgi:hypothetical protein